MSMPIKILNITSAKHHAGCVTHYERINVKNTNAIAVNARMIDPNELGSPPVKSLDVRKKGRP